jgi:hypothetical protein
MEAKGSNIVMLCNQPMDGASTFTISLPDQRTQRDLKTSEVLLQIAPSCALLKVNLRTNDSFFLKDYKVEKSGFSKRKLSLK